MRKTLSRRAGRRAAYRGARIKVPAARRRKMIMGGSEL